MNAVGPNGEALTAAAEDRLARAGWKAETPRVTIAPPDSGGLGAIERTCHDCHKPWAPLELGSANCANCGSNVFDERIIEPTPIEFAPERTGIGGVLRRLVKPEKPVAAPLAAEDVAVLRHAAEAGRAYIAALVEADAVARRLVRARVGKPETTGYLQDKLNLASSVLGDTSYAGLEAKGSLVLPVRTLSELIEETLEREHAT